jgi:hypothetical protein
MVPSSTSGTCVEDPSGPGCNRLQQAVIHGLFKVSVDASKDNCTDLMRQAFRGGLVGSGGRK